MKKLTFLFFLFSIYSVTIAQVEPVQHWIKNYSGAAPGVDIPNCSFRDNAGYTYVAGTNAAGTFIAKYDNTGVVTLSIQHVDSNNNTIYPKLIQSDVSGNIYLGGTYFYGGVYYVTIVKFDSNGNLIYNKDYNTNNGAAFINAMTSDNQSNPTTFAYTGRINDSIAVGKFSVSSTDWQWNKKFFPSTGSYSYAIGADVKISGGNIYVCGIANSPTTLNDAVIIKVNGLGAQMYLNTYDGPVSSHDNAENVIVNSSGEAFIYGTSYTPAFRFYVSKFNSVGGTEWTSYYTPPAGQSVSYGVDMCFNSTFSKIYTLGQTFGTGGDNGCVVIFNPGSGAIEFDAIVNTGTDNEIFQRINTDNINNFYVAGIKNVSYLKLVKFDASNALIYNANYPTPINSFTDLHLDNTGNAYVTGSINLPNTFADALLAKFSSLGNFLWDGYFNAEINSQDNSSRIIMDPMGDVYFAGNSYNTITGTDVILNKTDAAGNTVWSNTLDYGTHDNYLVGMAKDNGNNLTVASSDYIDGRTNITRVDPNGNTLWSNYLEYSNLGALSCDASGNFVLGESNSTGIQNFKLGNYGFLATTNWANTPVANSSLIMNLVSTMFDAGGNVYAAGVQQTTTNLYWIYVEKYDNTGNFIWGTKLTGFDSTQYNEFRKMQLDNSGNLLIGGNVYLLSGRSAAMIAKIDPSTGAIIFKKTHNNGDTRNQALLDFSINSSDEIIVPGGYYSGPGFTFPVTAILTKLDVNGDSEWEYVHPTLITGAMDFFQTARFDVDNNIIGVARVSYQINPFTTGAKMTTVKLDNTGNHIWETDFQSTYPGFVNISGMEVFNNRIYITGTAIMSPGASEDNILLKYCDNAMPNIIEDDVIVCNGTTVSLNASGSYYQYNWQPNGESTHTLDVTTSGDYWLIATDADGCSKISDTATVVIKPLPSTPEICAATVDTASTHNIIYWDKSTYTDISHFVIYREDVTNIYTPIGSVPFDSLSEYHDYGVNPNITTKRYKISAVDTCGTESLKSNFHNTLYVTDNGLGQFSWNLYEIESSPNPVVNYVLYRDDNGTGVWNSVGTTAGTQQVLNDPDYSLYPDANWRVETVWGITCTPTRAGVSTSRSNVRNRGAIMNTNDISTNDITVSPNPATEIINLHFSSSLIGAQMYLCDVAGRTILSDEVLSSAKMISIHHLENGIYLLKTVKDNVVITKQIIKN